MSAPRLQIDLDKIRHNARVLTQRLARRGISVTGVTKATLGAPEVATAMLEAGVARLGDARIENIETMRAADVVAAMTLVRSPMPSQAQRVVRSARASCNTEIEVISQLSFEAHRADLEHGIMLMVELGDLREGIMPNDLMAIAGATLALPNIRLDGIGANLACRSGVVPDALNMARLSELAEAIEARFGVSLQTVSGGNSANLQWALHGADPGRINDLRLGEAILLGRETLHRQPLDGLFTDAIVLYAEVIEAKIKPSKPWGSIAQAAFGAAPPAADRGLVNQAILALGRQDIDAAGLQAPTDIIITGSSSDHLIVESDRFELTVGAEVMFQLDYTALLRAMTSPFVSRDFINPSKLVPRISTLASGSGRERHGLDDQDVEHPALES